MLIAVATASYAQTNTATLNQNAGNRNDAKINQVGQLQEATIFQQGTTTTQNQATITQLGKANNAAIIELGKQNDVIINQDNATNPSSTHTALVQIVNDVSDLNVIRVAQTGKLAKAIITMDGDENQINFTQGGDDNKARYVGATNIATNDENIVNVTQAGRKNESTILTAGDANQVTIDQSGNDNRIGNFSDAAPQPVIGAGFNRTRDANSVTNTPGAGFNPNATRPLGGLDAGTTTPTGVAVPAGINILGDRNVVSATQTVNTRNNQVGIQIGRVGSPNGAGDFVDNTGGNQGFNADDNTVTVIQSGTARDNVAAVNVAPGADLNTGRINQTDRARGNSAGISFEGDDDVATINQSGDFNRAITVQSASTFNGSNNATINQPGNNNTAYIQQDGTRGSIGSITQNTNGNYAELIQSDNGGHVASLTQNVIVPGSRLIVDQVGTQNTAVLTQGQGLFIGVASTFELQQTGVGNTATGISNSGNQRVVQTGNGNSFSF